MFSTCFLLSTLALNCIEINGSSLVVEIADTAETRSKGLMFRETLEPDHGMFFIFDSPQVLSFWMKNTYIPLSIAFFDEHQTLLETIEMPVLPSNTKQIPIHQSSRAALYALEAPAHWFKNHQIKKGAKFSFLNHLRTIK